MGVAGVPSCRNHDSVCSSYHLTATAMAIVIFMVYTPLYPGTPNTISVIKCVFFRNSLKKSFIYPWSFSFRYVASLYPHVFANFGIMFDSERVLTILKWSCSPRILRHVNHICS